MTHRHYCNDWAKRKEPHYGMILFSVCGKKIKYGLVKRSITYGLNGIIMGGYSLSSFKKMSNDERDTLYRICKFEENWEEELMKMWIKTTSHIRNLQRSFETLKNEIKTNCDFILETLNNTISICPHGLWEFPKGRRERHESVLQCALRETSEETKIPLKDIYVTNQELSHEHYHLWDYAYFVGQIRHTVAHDRFLDNGETTEIKWCELPEVLNLLPLDMVERQNIVKHVEKNIRTRV